MSKATGASLQTSCNDLNPGVLGACAKFEERQVGGERYNFFSGCDKLTTCTIILRGGAEQASRPPSPFPAPTPRPRPFPSPHLPPSLTPLPPPSPRSSSRRPSARSTTRS